MPDHQSLSNTQEKKKKVASRRVAKGTLGETLETALTPVVFKVLVQMPPVSLRSTRGIKCLGIVFFHTGKGGGREDGFFMVRGWWRARGGLLAAGDARVTSQVSGIL